jgi:hypothetical protein
LEGSPPALFSLSSSSELMRLSYVLLDNVIAKDIVVPFTTPVSKTKQIEKILAGGGADGLE